MKRTDPPIACQLGALNPVQQKRQRELLETVRGKVQATRQLPSGFELQMPPDRDGFIEIAEWISLERRCCPFVEFSLEWRLDDSVWVRLTGPPGAREVLAAEMGLIVAASV